MTAKMRVQKAIQKVVANKMEIIKNLFRKIKEIK